jgi:hypothetical protein
MSLDVQLAEERARQAYEAGRRSLASWVALPLAAIGGLAACLGAHPVFALSIGVLIVLFAWVCVWRGRVVGRAVLPGVMAGLVPLVLAFAAKSYGHVCSGSECYSLCVPACSVGGVVAGLLIARLGRHVATPVPFYAVAAALAGLEGALGCSCVGFGGLAGLGVGLGATILMVGLRRLIRSSR